LGELQVGNPKRLYVDYFIPCTTKSLAKRIEDSLHKEYKNFHELGEWYKLPRAEIQDILLKYKQVVEKV
jgi:hypothetical protein